MAIFMAIFMAIISKSQFAVEQPGANCNSCDKLDKHVEGNLRSSHEAVSVERAILRNQYF